MDKKILKERLADVRNQLRTNAKEVYLFDKLFDEAISIKGQMDIEPTELDCGKKIDEFKGETYRISLTDRGVLYHEYGGYSIFATPRTKALYDTLSDVVVNKDEYAKAEGEDKERLELTLSAIGYCLAVPRLAFTDVDLTFDIAGKVVDFIKNKYDTLMNEPLRNETPIENAHFEETTIALENLKEASKEA